MVIKTGTTTKRPTIPGKKPFGVFYEAGKELLKAHGYYEDFKQYDPGYYAEKYTYKPHKRVAGYLGQAFYKKKSRIQSKTCRLDEERCL